MVFSPLRITWDAMYQLSFKIYISPGMPNDANPKVGWTLATRLSWVKIGLAACANLSSSYCIYRVAPNNPGTGGVNCLNNRTSNYIRDT